MLGVERECRDDDARALSALTAELADKELKPAAAAAERDAVFPRDAFRLIGRAGLLTLPYPESLGGAGQPYETYLQVVEELAGAWLTIGLGVSVHVLSCFPLVYAGTAEQQERWLPGMLSGDLLGASCLSAPGSGSDAAGMRTRASAAGSPF